MLKPVGFPPRLERSVNVGAMQGQARSYLPREKCKHRWGEGKKEGNMMKLNMALGPPDSPEQNFLRKSSRPPLSVLPNTC
ncbi:hypothetical protein B8W95_12995, partial [Staphylococcus pasteuri]